MPAQQLKEVCWQQFSADPIQWWDFRRSNANPWHPDFKLKSNVALWLSNHRKPAWVDSQLATWYGGVKRPFESVSTSLEGQAVTANKVAGHAGLSEVGMCRKLCEDGRIADAVESLSLLVQQGFRLDNNLFYRILLSCIAQKDLVLGRRIHTLTVQSGYEGNAFLATHLIGLYASHGRLDEAMRVFTKVVTPDKYNWAAILFAYARHGNATGAIRLYKQMLKSTTVVPTDQIYVAVLKACAAAGDLVAGKEIHAHILASPRKRNIFVQTSLLTMYANCGSLEEAQNVFDMLPHRDVVVWTAMIASYTQQGMGQEALSLYNSMQQEGLTPPDTVTFLCLLQACASVGVGALHEAKQLHAQIKEQGLQASVVLGGSLINTYAKCGSLEDARTIFDRVRDKDVVTWTVMIAGYAQQGMGQEALGLYNSMQLEGLSLPNSVTFVCLLQACAGLGFRALHYGKHLHAQIEERGLQADVLLGGSMVNMYAKCGCLEDARSIFDRLHDRNVVTWNAMLAGYVQQGMGEEAITLCNIMQGEGITSPNSVTYVCLLQACAIVAALPLGKQLHAEIREQGLEGDPVVGAALVNMYAKCGSMLHSQMVFDALHERSMEAWGALTGGYSRQGDSEAVFNLVERRMRVEGLQPDGITFLSVLTVCSHVGLVDKGRMYFEAMRADYGISPCLEHYICMMDLLGRAGHVDEALEIAKSMPFPPDGAVWQTLLGSCQKWNSTEIGQQAVKCAGSSNGKEAAPSLLMSTIYASA